MSVRTIVQAVLQSGQLSAEQERIINGLLTSGYYREADLVAFRQLRRAIKTHRVKRFLDKPAASSCGWCHSLPPK